MSDDSRRVELTPRQIRDLEERLERQRSQDEEEANGAAHEIAGYLRSALNRKS
jgi:hypothetical protein